MAWAFFAGAGVARIMQNASRRALHSNALERVRVVLVSPQQAGNVGSVCRVTTNFDCNELWLVDPQCDFKGVEAQTMAANVTSRSNLELIHVTSSLSEALRDCSMAVGFTRRSGVLRIPDTQLSHLQTPSAGSLNLALVFGREDRGLTNSELMHCTHVCSIPSASGAGSLNLSHAVAVVLSRLYEQVPQERAQDPSTYLPPQSTSFKSLPGTASVEAVENLMRRWQLVLQACNQVTVTLGIPNYRMQERMLIHVRRMLLRTGPSLRELGFLHGFLTMVETVASRVQSSQASEKSQSSKVGIVEDSSFLVGDANGMGEVRERRRSSWSPSMGPYQLLLYAGENGVLAGPEELTHSYQGVGVYDGALPCCGCGVGWCCFLLGFMLPLFWYYATFLFIAQCHNDPRERPGLAACAIAALVNTVALVLALLTLFVQHQGFFQSSRPPPPDYS